MSHSSSSFVAGSLLVLRSVVLAYWSINEWVPISIKRFPKIYEPFHPLQLAYQRCLELPPACEKCSNLWFPDGGVSC